MVSLSSLFERDILLTLRYYSKLPSEVTADLVFILDRESYPRSLPYPPASEHPKSSAEVNIPLIPPALIATGGTAVAAIGMLTEWGLRQDQIKLVSVLGSQVGVKHVAEEYPGVEVSAVGAHHHIGPLQRHAPHRTYVPVDHLIYYFGLPVDRLE